MKASSNLFWQSLKAVQKPRPEISEQGSVDFLEAFFSAGIHTDIQLSHWNEVPEKKKNLSYIDVVDNFAQYFLAHSRNKTPNYPP